MLREVILRNLGWKILSLGLAVAIWLTVRAAINERGGDRVHTFEEIPAQIVSGTTDVRAFRVSPEKVSVTVQGPSEIINVLTDREIRTFIDLTSADVSQNFKHPVRVATPPGVTVMRIDPADVTVIVPSKPPGKFPSE